MKLELHIKCIPDPDGHNPALLLKGDWIILEITDGEFSGYGEISHSRNDAACIETAKQLFERYIKNMNPSFEAVKKLEGETFSRTDSFIQATAISGINQALYELMAKRAKVPVWKFCSSQSFPGLSPSSSPSPTPSHSAAAGPQSQAGNFGRPSTELRNYRVPAYATINRALTSRTIENYMETVECALNQGFSAIKCAPFEMVTEAGDQVALSRYGLSVLKKLRENFPDLSIRIDFHERFRMDAFKQILPEILEISPHWLEAPLPIGDAYTELRSFCKTRIALGELFYGMEGFRPIIERNWADVIMPDVKHAGGFGPLLDISGFFCGETMVEISPHNPSGPVSAAASLHAAALSKKVTSIELPLITGEKELTTLIGWMEVSLRCRRGMAGVSISCRNFSNYL